MIYKCSFNDNEILNFIISHQNREDTIGIRLCRGSKMRNLKGFFAEISAVFQFPYYFGENWNAFNDCMSDLCWLQSPKYLLFITNAEQLLLEEDEQEMNRFINSMDFIIAGWGGDNENLATMGRGKTDFKLVLQGSNFRNNFNFPALNDFQLI